MALRTSWEGHLKLNLLSVPVKAFNAAIAGKGRIGFNQLHEKCHSRIRHKKFCPIHGEVSNDEIVSGYEYAKGNYVLVDSEELEELKTQNEKAITIDLFVSSDAIDPVYHSGKTFYLLPDGKVAEKPYVVLQRVMAEQNCQGIAQVVFSGRSQVVLVRPVEKLLAMTFLNFAEQVREPMDFTKDVPDAEVSAKEMELAETLVESSTVEEFSLSQYKDEYGDRLKDLLEGKVAKNKSIAKQADKQPSVINLMDALRKSLDEKPGRKKVHKAKAKSKRSSTSRMPKRRKTG